MIDIKIEASTKNSESICRETLVSNIHNLIREINNDYQFDRAVAEEWVDYLILLLQGYKENLANPYSDIERYDIYSFSQSTPELEKIESLFILDELPTQHKTSGDYINSYLSKTLFITALGGLDTTFYQSLDSSEFTEFAKEFYAPDVVASFSRHNAIRLIPRGFVGKKTNEGYVVTNVESMLFQAYTAGIRNVAVIANAMTYRAIKEYLEEKFHKLEDLSIIVTAQPLLPRIKIIDGDESIHISRENGAYPGGHGHGFKYCLTDKSVRACIDQNQLRYFLFTNGDNAAVLNWGGDHFEKVLHILENLKQKPDFKTLRIGFFLVWEFLRKGGFSFLLKEKNGNRIIPQIFEAELAGRSGADIKKLENSRGGYNTNVAVGIIQDVYSHLQNLPMALKMKKENNKTLYTFEASLATAMTTHHTENGKSKFDSNTAINILGPKSATYQHWNHIALRKRDDLFAFYSSIFKIDCMKTKFSSFQLIISERNATRKYPALAGNFIDSRILNIKEFFDIFVDANVNVDDFYGTLSIDLEKVDVLPRGIIKFENNISLIGSDESVIECTVPAGEKWIISDKIFHINKKRTITHQDAIVLRWDAEKRTYV